MTKQNPKPKAISRRSFIGKSATAGAGALGAAAAASQLDLDDYFRKHYKELSPEDKRRVFARIEAEAEKERRQKVTVSDPEPIPGVKFVFCLNLSACNGNRRCVEACQKENNQDSSIQYIKVLEMPRGSMDPEKGDAYYEGEVPKKDKYYLPVQCNQCDEPPCVSACPASATWKEPDGIVVIDYDYCIGCRYCQAACPYEARHFNFSEPEIEPARYNPNQSYLSNRVRKKGVMEKCTFCLHRTRKGEFPACQEACPTGARKFGNILDPKSEVAEIIKNKNVFVLKEELGTIPSFFYYFD